ncbi:MAG TPA: hypothetical protein VNI20_07790, partial [Fimbriimonadaceae bacterium]|nr:hypothetical protein [Fimbriimonadaceae bacterium]
MALETLKGVAPGVRTMKTGGHVSRIYGVPFGYGFTPEQAASSFVSKYGSIFEPGMASLEMDRTQSIMDGKFVAVYFKETLMGQPVDKGYLTVLVKNDMGSPIVLASSNVQKVDLAPSFKQISSKAAIAAVRRADKSLNVESTPIIVVYQRETDSVLAWSFVVGNGSRTNPKKFMVFVDSTKGSILEWRNMIYNTDVSGHVGAMATPGLLPNETGNPPTLVNLIDVSARISGGSATRTDSIGNFTIPNAGTTAVDVISELNGSWVSVINDAGLNEVLTQNVTPPGPANFTFNSTPSEAVQAQVDGFIQTQAIHNFAKAINASYPGIDIQLPCHVNIASTCNAYYDGASINFYASGGGCPNTAFSTVVYHEYGHFIIDHGHPSPTGDYHEGMADVNAAFMADDACLSRDFFGPGTGCLRSAYNTVSYPCTGEVHFCGNVISGAFWLMKDALDVTMGAGPSLTYSRFLYLNSILLHPTDINPGITVDVLTLDDNDGDLTNGTPHYDEIAQGFNAKNLTAPVVNWLTITPFVVAPEFYSLPSLSSTILMKFGIQDDIGVLDPTSVRFVHRTNGGPWEEMGMLELFAHGPYYRSMNVLNVGDIVEWYVRAQDTDGHEVRYPQGKPAVTMFGTALTTTLNDTFETDTGWTVTNDPSLATGAWVRADPNGTFLNSIPANPENDSADAGTLCMFTGQAAVGGGPGDADVDGGPTRLTSPVFDLSGGNGVIDFQRW